ncbi:FMN-binding negative transcriptional regulator [Parahaliea mediterranea]|uniref:FMN-binding negative transcriptional regulator n=1 Tax=Parahaliea mediterranea TaxID=651086 RepID=UPI0013005961|nr:FMN-binding negative transcriptional regulator [Parahaliea mediterranea]
MDQATPAPAGYPLSRGYQDSGEALFVPASFRFRDEAAMLAVAAQYPLAQLFSARGDTHRVTASPMVLLPQRSTGGALQFVGHMARRNPHAASLTPGSRATAVFSGPGAYVSPAWFRVTPTAPTWNYQAVQAHGTIEPIDCASGITEVLRRTIAHLEQGAHPAADSTRWHFEDLPTERAEVLLEKVVAFRLLVEHLEGVNRLNQDKHLDDITAILCALGRSPQPQAAAVVAAMAGELAAAAPLHHAN